MLLYDRFCETEAYDMKRKSRDDFSQGVQDQIAKKSGYRCSNPDCPLRGTMLIGPSRNFKRVVYTGVAAHICAAAPGGPRYDPAMTHEERSAEENGLFLCGHCARLIDTDVEAYPPELLRQWRMQAYQRALAPAALDNGVDPRCRSVVEELVRVCLCTYQTRGQVLPNARFRSCAGILYRLLFEDLPQEADYEEQMKLWESAVQKIADSVLERVSWSALASFFVEV